MNEPKYLYIQYTKLIHLPDRQCNWFIRSVHRVHLDTNDHCTHSKMFIKYKSEHLTAYKQFAGENKGRGKNSDKLVTASNRLNEMNGTWVKIKSESGVPFELPRVVRNLFVKKSFRITPIPQIEVHFCT